MVSWPWNELGLDGPAELPEIRRAYAQRLKTTHPEEDPEGFQRLHSAFQEASRTARRKAPASPAVPPPEDREEKPQPERSYDGLPKEEEEPPRAEEQEWDYERLFAEGEEEAQQARRRKLEELREKNKARYAAQEKEQRERAARDEETWAAVCAAAHALDLLYASGRPTDWEYFLRCSVFLNVQTNPDFLFALEDFLEQHPDLPQGVRRAIYAAYEARNASRYPIYRRLYQLLGVGRREQRQERRRKSQWQSAWRSYPAWRKAGIVLCFSILAVFLAVGWAVNIRAAIRDHNERAAQRQWEENILGWLEEDYGEPFELAIRDHIYAPLSDSTLYFWVLPEGERAGGQPGYRTDYAHIRIMRAMKDFAKERSLDLKLDSAGGFSGAAGDAPGAYLFNLPLRGAEEDIAALGALAEELKAQDWYQAAQTRYGGEPLEYQIFLCHQGLSFYDAISTRDGGFDTEEALSRYASAGPAFCRYILENSALAAQHMGEDNYLLVDQGTVEVDGQVFFQVAGFDKKTQEPKVEYLMSGGMLFCLPEGKEVFRTTDLYRGSVSHLQLDGVGPITVMDQTAS